MKTRKEGSKARLLGLSCMALVLTAFGVTGVRADAADAKKSTATGQSGRGKGCQSHRIGKYGSENADLLTDGDKYYLQHDATGNKEGNKLGELSGTGNRSHQHCRRKNGVWVQVDLGASYPLEVINLKRQVYDGQATIGNGNPSGQGKRLKGTKISYKKYCHCDWKRRGFIGRSDRLL